MKILVLLVCFFAACAPRYRIVGEEPSPEGYPPAAAPRAGPPVRIDKLTARVTSKYRCYGKGTEDLTDCADYDLTFVLRNAGNAAIHRLDRATVTAGPLDLRSDELSCADVPWRLVSGGASLLEIRYSELKLRIPCGTGVRAKDMVPAPPPPTNGRVTLRLNGLLEDGTAWTAEASADLRDGT